MSEPIQPRSKLGQFVPLACPDPHCDGSLKSDRDGWFKCDGLTHATEHSPLFACNHSHHPDYADTKDPS